MGSVIKKRRKRMSKKKHRKLLRKTRHQRRRKRNKILSCPPPPGGGGGGFCVPTVFAGWVLSARFFASGFVFVEGMCGSPVWGAARYLRDWDYD